MNLDDLIALNDEIAALVRAGVPLEMGLAELGGDLPGRLGRFATALAQRTAQGESLAQAIAGDAGQLPQAYRAVVEAGVRAGRLPAALEAVAAILALRDGMLPPTANYRMPDAECDLDVIPNRARAAQVEYALSNSFAFGGLNAVLAFKKR